MKRNVNLIELSRDHHFGLLLGWKVRQGLKNGAKISEIVHYIKHFSKEALIPHFDEEETCVLPYIADDNPYKIRTEQEHTEILSLINDLKMADDTAPDQLTEIVEKLDQHIRFEEREFFPYLEQNLSERELSLIGDKLEDSHSSYTENYENEFWIRKAN